MNNKIIIARHVDIVENDENLIGYQGEKDLNNELEKTQNSESNESDESDENEDNHVDKRISKRNKKPVVRYGNLISNFIHVNFIKTDVPNNFEEAINSRESEKWKVAMDNEMNCLNKNETWIIIDKPENKKIIALKKKVQQSSALKTCVICTAASGVFYGVKQLNEIAVEFSQWREYIYMKLHGKRSIGSTSWLHSITDCDVFQNVRV